MSRYEYDLFTIGAGSGGVRASRVLAEQMRKRGIDLRFEKNPTAAEEFVTMREPLPDPVST